ncbi:hypothetical protein DPMN_147102 [Dreissena polymorpha]|uniref:Uncharacterized protein n=1 Tax=Dreissena polymorpha TaxID=45954 RepID=A0A9D4F9X1_DREPO|nr:hypothetical protein DPMN_147102 [Dreissena polymorpha]
MQRGSTPGDQGTRTPGNSLQRSRSVCSKLLNTMSELAAGEQGLQSVKSTAEIRPHSSP